MQLRRALWLATVLVVSSTLGLGSNAVASPLTIAADVIATGSIGLTASDQTEPGDDVTINSGVTVQSITDSVTINAGDNFVSSTSSLIAAAGSIVINVDFGDADTGVGGVATVLGDYDALQVEIFGNSDSDVFNISPDDDTTITVTGGAGDVLNYLGSGFLRFTSSTSGIISASGFADVIFSGFSSVTGATVVPEPATLGLLGAGLLGLGLVRRKRAA